MDTLWITMEYDSAQDVTESDTIGRSSKRIDVSCCDIGVIGPWPHSDGTVFFLNLGDPQTFFFSADTVRSDSIVYRIVRHIDGELGERCEVQDDGGLNFGFPPPNSWGWIKHNLHLVSTNPGGVCDSP